MSAADKASDRAARLEAEVAQLRRNIFSLLETFADPGRCKGCGAEIWWIVNRNKKRVPLSSDGLVHFATCPQAKRFRTKSP